LVKVISDREKQIVIGEQFIALMHELTSCLDDLFFIPTQIIIDLVPEESDIAVMASSMSSPGDEAFTKPVDVKSYEIAMLQVSKKSTIIINKLSFLIKEGVVLSTDQREQVINLVKAINERLFSFAKAKQFFDIIAKEPGRENLGSFWKLLVASAVDLTNKANTQLGIYNRDIAKDREDLSLPVVMTGNLDNL
jgi:hypothetical protein